MCDAPEDVRVDAIVEYVTPAQTYFVDLVEPLPQVLPNYCGWTSATLGKRRTLR